MIKNYFKIAWRNLMKSKVFSFINIVGLSVGITVCLMIYLFIMNELGTDGFHQNGKNIYRVVRTIDNDGARAKISYLSGPYGPALLNDFKGEILRSVRVNPTDNLINIGTSGYHEKKVIDVDTDFFELFTFPLLRGDKHNVLKDPHSVVLTQATANRYFGGVDNAMGKTITVDKTLPLRVTGVMKDVPSNSHMEFDLVIPVANSGYANSKNWINHGLYVYIQTKPGVSQQSLEKRFPAFMEKYVGADMKKYGFHFGLELVPLNDAYFANTMDGSKHGSRTVVYIFLSIAVLILLIACINFMNLSTIRAAERSKEVGLRKVLGALRNNLVWQFIGESVLLTFISCVISVGLLWMLMPWYNSLLGYSLTVAWNTAPVYLFLLGIVLIVGFLAGSYPAFFLSAFSPVQALKGRLQLGKSGSAFRETLVVVQFCITVFLIVSMAVITKQMSYIKNMQLGYNAPQSVIVRIDNDDIYNHRNLFKKILEAQNGVQGVSLMSGEPGGFFDGQTFDVEGHNGLQQLHTEFTDLDYVKTLGIKIVAGRDLSYSFPTDSSQSVLINQKAAAQLGWTPQQAIGKWVKNTIRDSVHRRIVGVVADFNFASLRENIGPLVISPGQDNRLALIKLAPGDVRGRIETIRKAYNSVASAYPFEYSFLDDNFDTLYKKDLQQQSILSVFAGLAIFVACLGLFGLAAFTATKRFKEIGVRKVLGSSVQSVVVLLSKDLLKPVVIATCLALPIGYYCMYKWLESFVYKTPLSWWVFALAATTTFGIALATVCIKAVQAALANPVESLRSE